MRLAQWEEGGFRREVGWLLSHASELVHLSWASTPSRALWWPPMVQKRSRMEFQPPPFPPHTHTDDKTAKFGVVQTHCEQGRAVALWSGVVQARAALTVVPAW